MYVDVPDPQHPGRLLFRYDPVRQLIEVQHRGVKTVVDLRQYDPYPAAVVVDCRPRTENCATSGERVGFKLRT